MGMFPVDTQDMFTGFSIDGDGPADHNNCMLWLFNMLHASLVCSLSLPTSGAALATVNLVELCAVREYAWSRLVSMMVMLNDKTTSHPSVLSMNTSEYLLSPAVKIMLFPLFRLLTGMDWEVVLKYSATSHGKSKQIQPTPMYDKWVTDHIMLFDYLEHATRAQVKESSEPWTAMRACRIWLDGLEGGGCGWSAGELPQFMLNCVVKKGDGKMWLDLDSVKPAFCLQTVGVSGFSPYLHQVFRLVEVGPGQTIGRHSAEIFVTKHPKGYDDFEKALNRDSFATGFAQAMRNCVMKVQCFAAAAVLHFITVLPCCCCSADCAAAVLIVLLQC